MTRVVVYTHTHSVTFVADNILKSLKEIIREIGLDPSNFVNNWQTHLLAIRTWLGSGHLERVVLEIYNPTTNRLIDRWDIDVVQNQSQGDGNFWVDTDQLRYHLRKVGVAPTSAMYELVLQTKPGRPDVPGWSAGSFRSTDGMVRQSLGATIEHNGLGAHASYWRKR
ncbi:HORMA domain containing protein [Myxococcus sp. MISCRS1]|uniref:HORMA domain containing protein n=1 Tax=Myxococcus TaxID=32 RepID=UPI00226D8D15|nr:HORMA domain containing protein [Myxococcus sp. MISCRS1]MCY0997156.1 HORMA domain containing protein [Myxococcus sp. MISCRS1]